jgi:hypothetical protein
MQEQDPPLIEVHRPVGARKTRLVSADYARKYPFSRNHVSASWIARSIGFRG